VFLACFLLDNLSTYRKYHGMNVHANFKELGFGGNLGYRLHPATISPLSADLSSITHV